MRGLGTRSLRGATASRRGMGGLLAAALLAGVGCGTKQVPTEPEPPPRAEEPSEEPDDEEPAPEEPEQKAPEPLRSRPAASRLLERAAAAEDDEASFRARAMRYRVLSEASDSLEAARVRLELAEGAVERGDVEATERFLGGLPADERLPPELRRRRGRVRAELSMRRGRWERAATRWRDVAAEADGEGERREALRRVARALFRGARPLEARQLARGRSALSPEGLERELERIEDREVLAALLRAMPERDPWVPDVSLRLARRRCEQADPAGCREAARRARETGSSKQRQAARELLEHVEAWTRADPARIGVLLPLSGRYEPIGRKALKGIELAIGEGSDRTLVVRDSRGERERAAEMVEALVFDEHVGAIVGPVGSRESEAAVSASSRLGVPHLLLTSIEGVAEPRPRAYRMRTSTAEEATMVARYAATRIGIDRGALLFPDHGTGRRYATAFWDELVRLDGRIRAARAYPPETKDFMEPVGKLLRAEEPGERPPGFEALFLPDDAYKVARLVPFLQFWKVPIRTEPLGEEPSKAPPIQLLGASGWHDPAIVDRGGRLTDNGVFVDAWYHDPDRRRSDRFARRFYARHGRKPDTFEAEAHDAAALVDHVVGEVEGTGHEVRDQLHRALREVERFEAATGSIALSEDGAIRRDPRVLTVDGDAIRPRRPEAQERSMRREGSGSSRP